MHEWIRPVGETPATDRWHLELVASPPGGRKAYCVSYFEPVETLEERTFERPPDIEDRCVACDLAYERIPRIPPRRAVDGLDIRRPALRERVRAEWIAGAEESGSAGPAGRC